MNFLLKRLVNHSEVLSKYQSLKASKIALSEQRLSQFQQKRISILAESIHSLQENEKEFLWQKIRDSFVEKLGIDPALMADFYPKLQNSEFSFKELEVSPGSAAGLVEVSSGKLKAEPKEESLKSEKPEAPKKQETKPEQKGEAKNEAKVDPKKDKNPKKK